MPTGTSAHLAKGKGKRVDTADIYEDVGRDVNYGQIESEEEEQPAGKRQPAALKSTKGVARKKQVRGKQSRLSGLINMPMDIFTEVASHLLPGDIISLARSNKFFRNLLMHRSAIHIWHGVMKNVEGLPACPPDMSEPHYLALLFSKTCSMCGRPARANMDPNLLVRLCGSCCNAHLLPREKLPVGLVPWVVFSESPRSSTAYVLREDVPGLLAQYEERVNSNDDTALKAWAEERREIVDARQNQGRVLSRFLDSLERARKQELADAMEVRQLEIERRLMEMGWAVQDMIFGGRSPHKRAWDKLVSHPKPLTDQIWSTLRPKLTPLLEANRELRISMERDERKFRRQDYLSEMLLRIEMKVSTELQLEATNPVTRPSSTGLVVYRVHQDPFPSFAHTLDWLVVRDLYETDSSLEVMKANFEAHRDEIEALIVEWKNQIQTRFVDLLRDGYERKGEELRPTITVYNGVPDPFTNVSDGLKLLLRADSLFYKPSAFDSSEQPSTYGTILFNEGLAGIHSAYGSTGPGAASNLDRIRWYPEAHEAARELLADMGRHDASYLEMDALRPGYACGKCHDSDCRDWEGMVKHYVKQKQQRAKIQEDRSRLFDQGIIYNDVHDPELFTDRPMIMDYATKTSANTLESGVGLRQICKVCEKIPAAMPVLAPKSGILKHLLDVHAIAEPKADEHYTPEDISHPLDLHDYYSDDSYSELHDRSYRHHSVSDDDSNDVYIYDPENVHTDEADEEW